MSIVANGRHEPVGYFAGRMKYIRDASIAAVLKALISGESVRSPSGGVTIDAIATLEPGLIQLRLFRPQARFAATIMVRALDPSAEVPACWLTVTSLGVRWRLSDCDLTALKTARQD